MTPAAADSSGANPARAFEGAVWFDVRRAGVPLFNLAILDDAGKAGLIGRGLYTPQPELFSLDNQICGTRPRIGG
jgi:hypothetical protein